ncbi:unnamed protein product, partial [Eretmochelys imbricata]
MKILYLLFAVLLVLQVAPGLAQNIWTPSQCGCFGGDCHAPCPHGTRRFGRCVTWGFCCLRKES